MRKRNKHIGSSLDDFLKEEGVLKESRAVALKETVALQVQQAMEKEKDEQGTDGAAHKHKPRRA
jgi:hypothetical protein